MERQAADYRTLSSLKNALHALKCFTTDEPELGITQIAEKLGLSKSTVHRVMTTLAEEGFARRDESTHRYRLGLSVLSLGGIIMSNLEICREGQHLLEEFVNRFDETVHLAVLEDYATVYVSKLECKHPVQIATHLGRKNPLHCTSSGKVILAYQDSAMIEEVIQRGLSPMTPNTITNPDQLRQVLAQIRNDGYAFSRSELREGVHSVAAPVRDYTRQVIGAVTAVGPAARFTDEKMKSLAKTLISISKEISSRLGYYERTR
ncbi:IclR family transcriptional regulator [Alicyclobacillus sacchari]|uniref:Glycerol operon regulatory protein n=1 Tax=Alicyclobacillus sacchari TaxID=392010 RepID=A0A4R8LSM5_9BACL|nr:IclR family transcriptional regulator [Alicyclobacillus sacchari]TDY50669.1 IclR family transcriptional regulator [Alicyclobacillus sacchari]GMA55642.1 IclR family transcriptional regulator [Alicyclobacillus sacchari]